MGGNGKNKCGTLVGWCVWYLVIGWLSIWTPPKNWEEWIFDIHTFSKKTVCEKTYLLRCVWDKPLWQNVETEHRNNLVFHQKTHFDMVFTSRILSFG